MKKFLAVLSRHCRLYIAHMNADQLVVFDTKKRQVVANLDGFPNVHGVWAVPELGKVYASATGEHKVAVLDTQLEPRDQDMTRFNIIPMGAESHSR